MTKKKTEIIIHNGIKYKAERIDDNNKTQEEIEFEQWSDESYCLKAVERNGDALQYVKEQNEAICLKAVERNGYALQYVKEKKIFLKIIGKGDNNADNKE